MRRELPVPCASRRIGNSETSELNQNRRENVIPTGINTGRKLHCERLWPVRHVGQCLGVDRRLLELNLS